MKIRGFDNDADAEKIFQEIHNTIMAMDEHYHLGSISLHFGFSPEPPHIISGGHVNVPDDAEIKKALAISMIKVVTDMVKNHVERDSIFESFNKIMYEKNHSTQEEQGDSDPKRSDSKE